MFFNVSSIGRHIRVPSVLYLQEPHRQHYEASPRLPWAALDIPDGWWRSPTYFVHRVKDLLRTHSLRAQVREEFNNARAFEAILVNSYYSRESVLRCYGLDSKVCYLGIDTELFGNQAAPRENLVVGIGLFAPHKNIEFVIKALSYIRKRRPGLAWIGNGGDSDYLEELQRVAASCHVSFEPKLKVSDSELVAALNRASIMVYAPRLEPFGFAPLEANACGLPVVAVAEGGVRETIVDGFNGVLVEHDPEAMAAAVQQLLDHPEYARQLGENGSKLVAERWTATHSVDRLERRLVETLRHAAVSSKTKAP